MTASLRPWNEIVHLHPDVEAGGLTDAAFAIDLGAIAVADPGLPAAVRDPEAFFRSTFITADLHRLLEEVLASLTGPTVHNRVLKLRSPFGGGKSHTLAALLHAARTPEALSCVPEAEGLARPPKVAVAVFDGEKFDARDGKPVEGGLTIQTMWGWLAWQISPTKAFPLVAGHDRDRVAPGGDVVRELLTTGAEGRPVLILLDEVLKYMERAAAVAVLDSTLQRQAKDFFQNLTVEVARTRTAVLVYALTWSARESLGNIALLQEIDKLAARVDQLREPVSGDEVLAVLQRRLLAAPPPTQAASDVAAGYAEVVTGMRRAYADSESEKRQAEEDGLHLRDRIRAGYPFHPALIDLMRERWSSVEAFQRTRGALRLLATALAAAHIRGLARPLLAPGDLPLVDPDVRIRVLKELGAQNQFDAMLNADLVGPNARARKIDERLVRESPALANVRPAQRLATTIFLYSFGGLRRETGDASEALPPGVSEAELMAACIGPDLDPITARSVLAQLRTSCLYLHFDGVRYCFKKDPNVGALVEEAEQDVSRQEVTAGMAGPVRGRIKEQLEQRLAGRNQAIVWPAKSHAAPDNEPTFLVAYMPLELGAEPQSEQERVAKEYFAKCGDKVRNYRNGIGLAVPDRGRIEELRRATRYLLAIERVEAKKAQHHLTKEQVDELKERRRTEEAAIEAAFRELYPAVWLPRVEEGALEVEKVEKGGRPLQATGVHERVMELLTGTTRQKVFSSLSPSKVVDRLRLGEAPSASEPVRVGVSAREVRDSFFSFLEPPRLDSEAVLRRAVARGVAERVFAYTSAAVPPVGADGRYSIPQERIRFGLNVADDEIDLESGFLILPQAIPESQPAPVVQPVPTPPIAGSVVTPPVGATPTPPGQVSPAPGTPFRTVTLRFAATRDQVFKAFKAIANLADRSDAGSVVVTVEGTSQAGYDSSWLRNAVKEPLEEAGVSTDPAK